MQNGAVCSGIIDLVAMTSCFEMCRGLHTSVLALLFSLGKYLCSEATAYWEGFMGHLGVSALGEGPRIREDSWPAAAQADTVLGGWRSLFCCYDKITEKGDLVKNRVLFSPWF